MSALPPSHTAAEAFKPVRADGRPIFRQDCAEYATFYAPGYLCVVDLPNAGRFEATIGQGQHGDCGAELWRRAELAVAQANNWRTEPFCPECLTLYMNNECNLRCVYCHTDPSPKPAARLELEVIAAAAEVVAAGCREKGRPFYAVFHGGGEPILHRGHVDEAMTLVEKAASAHDVEIFRYVATNGVMPAEKARWLADCFDLIGLSCDGPPDVQNRQRPLWSGGGSARILERTGHILRQESCQLHVRTTITGATLHQQAEIADYICQTFSPQEIHFEPVYVGGRATAATRLGSQQADEFVSHFLRAREIARQHGVLLMSSGSRPASIHGPYCHLFRATLNLVPGGVATGCFKITDAAQAVKKGVAIGALNAETGRFELDHPRIQSLGQQLAACPPHCADCFNRYHCARECPDLCPLDDNAGQDGRQSNDLLQPGFRCRVQKATAYAALQEAAERLWSTALAKETGEKRENAGDEPFAYAQEASYPIVCGIPIL